ncbi:hypothetical protein ACIRRA_41930 [Nocardia sp. NPDC101769]|uniref:hypothetical protein n=1 Tax=Nocardia sp. NPDC101769 TaxID=3364333 RepID=UPI0037FCDE59
MGDTLFLYDSEIPDLAGTFRVIGRDWIYTQYGSASWPFGEPEPKKPSVLQVLLEPADEFLHNEEPADDEDERADEESAA